MKVNNRWLTFEEARKIVRKTTIKTEMQWKYERKFLPKSIPRDPNKVYREEWRGFSDWLGTKNIRGCLRKYKVNDNFFKTWSHDMAYVLGFWWADGYMRKRIRKNSFVYGFALCQQTKDKYILKNILNAMGSNNPIYTPKSRPSSSHFEINSKIIFDDLIALGGVPNKSKFIRMPSVPHEFIGDFIRGLFDGDGSISINKKYKTTKQAYICSGNIDFINDLKTILDNLGINGIVDDNANPNNICYLLRFNVEQIKKLGILMYKDLSTKLKLVRKFKKFLNEEGGII